MYPQTIGLVANDIQIGEAFKTFGLDNSTQNIIVVKVSSSDPKEVSRLSIHLTNFFKVHDHVQKIVNGKELTFDDKNLQSLANFAKICKVYKLELQNNGKRKAGSENCRWNDPVECTKVIVGSIALRGSS